MSNVIIRSSLSRHCFSRQHSSAPWLCCQICSQRESCFGMLLRTVFDRRYRTAEFLRRSLEVWGLSAHPQAPAYRDQSPENRGYLAEQVKCGTTIEHV